MANGREKKKGEPKETRQVIGEQKKKGTKEFGFFPVCTYVEEKEPDGLDRFSLVSNELSAPAVPLAACLSFFFFFSCTAL